MVSLTPANNQPPAQAGEQVQVNELVHAFLSGRNPRTLKAYRQDLADFQAFTKTTTTDAAARALLSQGHGKANLLLLEYRAHLVERGSSVISWVSFVDRDGPTGRKREQPGRSTGRLGAPGAPILMG